MTKEEYNKIQELEARINALQVFRQRFTELEPLNIQVGIQLGKENTLRISPVGLSVFSNICSEIDNKYLLECIDIRINELNKLFSEL